MRKRRISGVFAVIFAMMFTAMFSGVAFASEGGSSVIAAGTADELGAVALQYAKQVGGGAASVALSGQSGTAEAGSSADAAGMATAGDSDNVKASGTAGALYTSWNPYNEVNINDPANVVQQNGSMAGRSITLTLAGRAQAEFLATAPYNTGDTTTSTTSRPRPMQDVGFIAYMPASITYGDNNTSESWTAGGRDDRWYSFVPPLTVSRTFNKAATFYNKVYYQKWTVQAVSKTVTVGGIGQVETTKYWELDTTTKYWQAFPMNLKGMVNFDGDGGGNKQVWVDNGSVMPKFTPKRKGFKFGGWFTKWPQGGTKMVPGKTKVWFGDGAEVKLYVHWDKKVPVTYDANKGKVGGKSKKVVNVKYRGKYGKAPAATRSGYSSLGWYSTYKNTSGKTAYRLHNKNNIVDVAKATFKAQYIKNGKGKDVSLSEYSAIVKAFKAYYVSKNNVIAAIGGKGGFVDSGHYRIWLSQTTYIDFPVDKYEWSGNKGDTTVTCFFVNDKSFGLLYNCLLVIGKDGGLK